MSQKNKKRTGSCHYINCKEAKSKNPPPFPQKEINLKESSLLTCDKGSRAEVQTELKGRERAERAGGEKKIETAIVVLDRVDPMKEVIKQRCKILKVRSFKEYNHC